MLVLTWLGVDRKVFMRHPRKNIPAWHKLGHGMRASAYTEEVQGVIWKQIERDRVSVARPLLPVDYIERGIPSRSMRRRIAAPYQLNFMPPDPSKRAPVPRRGHFNVLTRRVYTKIPRRDARSRLDLGNSVASSRGRLVSRALAGFGFAQ